jgi:hypothetical protein
MLVSQKGLCSMELVSKCYAVTLVVAVVCDVMCVCYEIHFLLQEWDQLLEQQREIEDKLQELEASPPRFMFI